MKIRVPATSANIGPGFDSVGLAVSCYLTIEVLESSDHWHIDHQLPGVPSDESNLLLRTALSLAPQLQPHYLKMTSDIPLARGLGSSSSVIVAGIELANQLADLQLSDEDKLRIATKIEGHPDNVAPAIFGDLVISSYHDEDLNHLLVSFPDCALVAYVPDYELKTSDSRRVLPETLSYKEAVAASSIANMMVAGLITGDWKVAGQAIEQDSFHEPYRQELVPEFKPIKELAHRYKSYATYLSGAGPTVMTFLPQEHSASFIQELSQAFSGNVLTLSIDREGVTVDD